MTATATATIITIVAIEVFSIVTKIWFKSCAKFLPVVNTIIAMIVGGVFHTDTISMLATLGITTVSYDAINGLLKGIKETVDE